MNIYILIMLTSVSGAVSVAFLLSMLFFEGRANINDYGEGWLEVSMTGIIALLGAMEIVRYAHSGP